MSHPAIDFFRNTAVMCKMAVEGTLPEQDFQLLISNLDLSARKLEAAANWLQEFEQEQEEIAAEQEINKILISIGDNLKIHPAITELLTKGTCNTKIESKNLSSLKQYMFIDVTKIDGGKIYYEKHAARIGGQEFDHEIYWTCPQAQIDFSVGKYYLVKQEPPYEGISFKHKDEIWSYAIEISSNEIDYLSGKLASIFSKAAAKGVKR